MGCKMGYLYIKALHIFFVMSWFTGLFYLPRLFVNLAMAKEPTEIDRLLLMAHKLYRFMGPLAIISVLLGIWMWFGYGTHGAWIHVKLCLVAVLGAYHLYCGHLYTNFAAHRNVRSHVWYRVFNEIPTILLLAIVILAVVKPF